METASPTNWLRDIIVRCFSSATTSAKPILRAYFDRLRESRALHPYRWDAAFTARGTLLEIAERLAAFKTPVQVTFQPEVLPRHANDKIMKPEFNNVSATELKSQ